MFWAAVSGSASYACIRTVHFIDVTVSRRRRWTHGLSVLIAPHPVCGRGTKPRGRLRVGLSPLGSRPRWLHGATSCAPASYILAQCLVQSWILLLKRETPVT